MPNFNCTSDTEGFYLSETLSELRQSILERLGYAARVNNPPPGMAALVNNFLRRGQAYLFRRYKSQLETERFYRWTMVAGERHYGFRDNIDDGTLKLDPGKITWVGVEDLDDVWTPLIQGISPTFFTRVADNGMPTHYEIRQCIEVFPAPDAAYTLRVKGRFGLMPFTADDDICTIDSELLFLYALANAKNHYGQPDAQDIAAQYRVMLGDLTAESHGKNRYVPGGNVHGAMTRPLFDDSV
jgi:hypothetical protein